MKYGLYWARPKLKHLRPIIWVAIIIVIFIIYACTDIIKSLNYQIDHVIKVNSLGDSLVVYPKNEPVSAQLAQDMVVQYAGNSAGLTSNIINDNYQPHPISIYSAGNDSEVCEDVNIPETMSINKYYQFQEDLYQVVEILQDQLDNDPAFKDLAPFFEGKIPEMIKNQTVTDHFYKFMGTSVWLKQYGVHLMISRVLFTRTGIRFKPQLSLMYGQLFNENWQELHNVTLRIPDSFSEQPGSSSDMAFTFPTFLPIPFFHDSNNVKYRYYGPEDGRILLVQNQNGFEEPIVVFNSFTKTKENDNSKKVKLHRSMFVGWLFQSQTGKENTDAFKDTKYDNVTYTKVRQFTIANETSTKRQEKNWTPFIDPQERTTHDGNIYLIYEWNNLLVLKCELTNFTSNAFSYCHRIYNETSQDKIGPLRGGTELIPVNHIKTDNQIWIGFIRSHIGKCGCGTTMYHPHLVILQRQGDLFRVSHMSSSISFNIPAKSLTNNNPNKCGVGVANVLMANGISNWEIDETSGIDYLTLTFSSGDEDTSIVHIKDFSKMLERLDLDEPWNETTDKMRDCVLIESKQFCKEYSKNPLFRVRSIWKRVFLFLAIFIVCIVPILLSQKSDRIKSLVQKFTNSQKSSQPGGNSSNVDKIAAAEVEEPVNNCQGPFECHEKASALSNTTLYNDYHEHTISLFSSMQGSQECKEMNTKHQVNISDHTLFPEDFNKLATVLIDQLENEDAFKDLAPFFQGKIPLMIENNTVANHFFKFAGTSVWLKDYGLHLMVSRVLFSRVGIKWDPQISLLYGEIFNENWEPITDIELKMSGTNHTLKFPSFLPIPFYHNVHHLKSRWYGPEDARILLVKNKENKEEPLVIFNAHHRKFSERYLKAMENEQWQDEDLLKEDKLDLPPLQPRLNKPDDDKRFAHYRSMFIAWPFQFEQGKAATDVMPDSKYKDIWFNKARELRIEEKVRNKVEKNWTPFIDPSERSPHDSHLHIVYDWEYLQVLKCELTDLSSDSFSSCKIIYDTPRKLEVGPIRGGTELIPLSMVRDVTATNTTTAPSVWVGFLRTHILDCGCGKEMYRPHLVIFRREGKSFKVSHMSSSIGFDVPLIGARNKKKLCANGDSSILMPNGISIWEYDDETDSDYLTLSLSRGDSDNIRLNIKDLGKLVEDDLEIDKKWNVKDHRSSINMKSCVLKSSEKFCLDYGKEIQSIFEQSDNKPLFTLSKLSFWKRIVVFWIIFTLCAWPLWVFSPDSGAVDKYIKQPIFSFHSNIYSKLSPVSSVGDRLVVFPKNDYSNSNQLGLEEGRFKLLYKGSSSALHPSVIKGPYSEQKFKIFNSLQDSDSECSSTKHKFDVKKFHVFREDYDQMADVLIDQLANDEAFKELAYFFEGKIPKMIQDDNVNQYFYKFAGTSVWLKDYGVHLMVSRVSYSKFGKRWDAHMSLLYAQVYDERWVLLHDIELKLPNSDTALRFPRFMPIPFYHKSNGVWFGPEDARLLLVKNENGHEEPVVVFNAQHEQEIVLEEGKDPQCHNYRAMFVGWLFQFQKGKQIAECNSDSKYNDIAYTKIRELSIEGQGKPKDMEKNWSPFIDPAERHPYDKHIYFVYEWHNLKVLKCELAHLVSDKISNCQAVFESPATDEIGPIRGATELLPLSTIGKDNKNTWIGFVKTHLKDCGCGKEMYRPHFFIFSRQGDSKFKVTHMSTSLGFNVPIRSEMEHIGLCAMDDLNIVMPNGISNWEYHKETGTDYMSITLSTGDSNNLIVHLKDVGKVVDEVFSGEWDDKVRETKMNQCVVDGAKNFCKAYGEEMTKLGLTEAQRVQKIKDSLKEHD
ncbi:Beta-mannosyltransferase 6 [Spathaspora sp. JA1]|nr:Beta-mannosyltransferase 6 [Spathaspora sp. JA1]